MAYRLLHPQRPITQRHEFWQSSGTPLPTQTIAARRHFTKDSYIQATWRGDEKALTGIEFLQRSAEQHREYAGGYQNEPTAAMMYSKDESRSNDPTPRSPRVFSHDQTRRLCVEEEGITLENNTDDEVEHERYIAGFLEPTDEEDRAAASKSQEPTHGALDPLHIYDLPQPNVAIPKPNLQEYKNGQFPLKSLKDDYGWDNDTYSRIQVSPYATAPTHSL
ncbi:hypothetical protein AAF712_014661 [Marasmius tenuissimus]|uniref:Uncharacterized protein n=1 Tax=Marasmius tenuissimus TaxID=585030 RepID=A0ABR2ZBF7_9AGAR